MRIKANHKLKAGDSLEDISVRYRVPVCMIMRANNLVSAQDFTQNRTLKIPCICYCSRCVLAQEPKLLQQYTVQPGDSVYSIARSHGITMKLLLNANSLNDPEALKPGEVLSIPRLSGEIYSVREGDSLEAIALRSGTCAERIREKNGLAPGEALKPGMRIFL